MSRIAVLSQANAGSLIVRWQEANACHFECLHEKRLCGAMELMAVAFEVPDRTSRDSRLDGKLLL
jgi:hypothetical protein